MQIFQKIPPSDPTNLNRGDYFIDTLPLYDVYSNKIGYLKIEGTEVSSDCKIYTNQ